MTEVRKRSERASVTEREASAQRRAEGEGIPVAGGKTSGQRSRPPRTKGVMDVDARKDTSPDTKVRGPNCSKGPPTEAPLVGRRDGRPTPLELIRPLR